MAVIELTADLFLVAAVRAGADSAGMRILPMARLREPLAPHDRFSQRLLLALQSIGYIEPELSMSHAEDWLLSRDWLGHGFENLAWRIVRSPSLSSFALKNWVEGADPVGSVFEGWVNVWEDLALAEVTQYTRSALAQSGFDPAWAEGAEGALSAALRKFSVADVSYLVHIALRSLALRQRHPSPGSGKLGQYFATSIQQYVERAVGEAWQLRRTAYPSRRYSAVAAVFADTVTGLGNRYFTERPCGDALSEALTVREALH